MDDTIHLAANAAPSDPPPDMAPPVAESPAPLACANLASPIEIRGKGVADRLLETPALEKLAANPRWAVSTPNKMLLAVRDYCETGAVRGASCHIEEDMCTLWEIAEMLPSAPNAAYYLNQALDDYAVFDVESKASAELKRSILRLRWSYAEMSMSGQGLHLLIPLKDISQLLDRLGVQSKWVDGLRVTDEETIDVVQMTLAGKVNKTLVNLAQMQGGNAMGISGMDGRLSKLCRRTRTWAM